MKLRIRFLPAFAIALICLFLPWGEARAVVQVTQLQGFYQEIPTSSQRSLLDAVKVYRSDGKTWIETEEEEIDFELVRGEGLVTIQGDQIYTGASTGTVLVKASLRSDPSISNSFYVHIYPNKYQVAWLGTNVTAAVAPGGSDVSGMCLLLREEGTQAFYPVDGYTGELNQTQPYYLDASGKLDMGENFQIYLHMMNGSSVLGLKGKHYEMVEATRLNWSIDADNRVQMGDRCYFDEESHIRVQSVVTLSGNCRGTWGVYHNYRKALATYLPEGAQQFGKCNSEIEMVVPRGKHLVSDPGGSFDLTAHLPEGTERMAVALEHSDRYQCDFYQTPLATPGLERDLDLESGSVRDQSFTLSGAEDYPNDVEFCAVWTQAGPLELAQQAIPLRRQGDQITVPLGALTPGVDYYLYARTDDEHFSLPSKGRLTVAESEDIRARFQSALTAGVEGRLDITLYGQPAQTCEVSFATDQIAIAPQKNLDYKTWAEIGGIREDVCGSFGGQEITDGKAARTVSFVERDGNATASIPITLCKAGQQTARVEIKGHGVQTLQFTVTPHPTRALLLDVPCIMTPSPNETLGGGTMHFGNRLRLVDKYANVITDDSSSVVTIHVTGAEEDLADLRVIGNQFTLQNGVADLNAEPMAIYNDRKGFTQIPGQNQAITVYLEATCDASGAYRQDFGGVTIYPRCPDGMSTTGELLTGPYAPRIKELKRVTENGDSFFRIYFDNNPWLSAYPVGAGIAGGASGDPPTSASGVISGGSMLEQDENGVYSDHMEGNRYSSPLERLDGTALYFGCAASDEPYWGYIPLVSGPVDLSGVEASYAGSTGTLTGLKPGGWYCVCGYYYSQTGTSWTGIRSQELQADAGGKLTFDIGSYDLDLLELDLVEARDTSFSYRTRFHAARFSIDKPIPGTSVCLRPQLAGRGRVDVTVDSYITKGIVAQQLYCVAYNDRGRPLATRNAEFFYDAEEEAAKDPYHGNFCSISEVMHFDFSGVPGIDHYKMFMIDVNGIPQAGSASLKNE